MSNLDLVNSTYKNLYGKDYTDQEGQDYWTNQLDTGGLTEDNLAQNMANIAVQKGGDLDYVRDAFKSIGLTTIGNTNINAMRAYTKDRQDITDRVLSGELLPKDIADEWAKKAGNYGYTWHEGAGKYVPAGAVGREREFQPTNGNSSNTVFGELISRLQGDIDSGKFDNSNFLADYQKDLNDYSNNVDDYTTKSINANNAAYRDNIDPAVQSTLNQLASKNMIKSSVAGDALSKTLATLASQNATTNAQIEASGVQNKLAIPELKANALNTAAQTQAAALLPYQTLIDALEIDMYKYTNAL